MGRFGMAHSATTTTTTTIPPGRGLGVHRALSSPPMTTGKMLGALATPPGVIRGQNARHLHDYTNLVL